MIMKEDEMIVDNEYCEYWRNEMKVINVLLLNDRY